MRVHPVFWRFGHFRMGNGPGKVKISFKFVEQVIHGDRKQTMNKRIILIGVTMLAVTGLAWAGRTIYRANRNIVSIDVYNAPLAEVIKQMEKQTWETILARSDLQTKVTLNLKNVPLDEARTAGRCQLEQVARGPRFKSRVRQVDDRFAKSLEA
jgi:hypothetical protein